MTIFVTRAVALAVVGGLSMMTVSARRVVTVAPAAGASAMKAAIISRRRPAR
ncbi:hypothetical protein [Chelatococcus albus]|uniref:hypothetical protein n=1 Tax=Chelatococcus albus TaxID=3047466 RepID=UPI0030EED09C